MPKFDREVALARYELKLKLLAYANDLKAKGDHETECASYLKVYLREIGDVDFDALVAVIRGTAPERPREEIVDALAKAFTVRLIDEIGEDDLREVARKNVKDGNEDICASHDYCDANMPMLEAFKIVLGREPLHLSEFGSPAADADIALWNEAWGKAKRGWPT